MATDYSKGRYNVYGPDGKMIGRIDCDEFVRSGTNLIYRLDGDEVYPARGGALLGFITAGVAVSNSGATIFTIKPE